MIFEEEEHQRIYTKLRYEGKGQNTGDRKWINYKGAIDLQYICVTLGRIMSYFNAWAKRLLNCNYKSQYSWIAGSSLYARQGQKP